MAGERTAPRKTGKKPAKKTAKKTSTSTAKKTAKRPARKTAEKTAEDTGQKTAQKRARRTARKRPATGSENGRPRQDAPRAASRPRLGATKIAANAAQQLLELTGRAAEGVTGLERSDDGWTVQVEVVEVRRIPDTTDVLGLYEVTTDEQGELMGYRRLRRYTRGNAMEE
jgi:hypothetical protein